MKYSEEQIREKYGENADEILRLLLNIGYELDEHDLVINFTGKHEESIRNMKEIIYEFTSDFEKFANMLALGFNLKSFLELQSQEDKKKSVEFISLEDKIVKINLLTLRILYIRTLLEECSNIQEEEEEIHIPIPFYFIFNAKSNRLIAPFFSDFKANPGIPKNIVCAKVTVMTPVEIRPNLKVVNGEKE